MDKPIPYISKAHDHFFRMAMSDKRVAREFFIAHLPQDILSVIKLDHLELQTGTYIDDMRKEAIADMLFKTTIAECEGYIYLLTDHQSKPDALMPFRILKYTCNIIDQHLKGSKSKLIPLIVPFVVYHGKQPWNYSTDIHDLVDAPRNLTANYFLKPFHLIDLTQIKDEVIKQNIWSGVMELALKHIFARDMLIYAKEIVELLKHIEQVDGKSFAETVLIYILDRGELSNKDAFLDLVKTELTREVGEKIMTIAEQLKAEGKLEGKLEIAKQLLAQNFDLTFISKITGLPQQRIEEIDWKH
jgi:recombination-promoting nuclease RpnB